MKKMSESTEVKIWAEIIRLLENVYQTSLIIDDDIDFAAAALFELCLTYLQILEIEASFEAY
jgi:thiamine monophosphate synthase